MPELFSPTSPALALLCLCIALLTAGLIGRFTPQPQAHARFQTIDGLRGYLAFFVFLHHAAIWFYYLREGTWQVPPSNLFTHFGQSGVALFFMITAFLFVTKPLSEVIRESLRWILFTVGGGPNINGVADTSIIMAGVTWSLPYEWLFYFSLPLIALLVGVLPPYVYVGFGLMMVALMVYAWHPDMAVIRCFWGGVIAAFLVRWT